MINILDKTHFEPGSFAAALCLDRQIIVSDVPEQSTQGHYVDYFDSATSYLTLCAKKDARFMVWESHALLEQCQDNFILNVHLKLSADAFALFGGVKELESWCARNRMALHKHRDEAQLTYYFTLFDAHKITGELLVSPVLYFAKNPVFTLHADVDVVSQFFKTEPIVLDIKKNQMVCFDKYHYQMAYHPDFNFIRVHDVH